MDQKSQGELYKVFYLYCFPRTPLPTHPRFCSKSQYDVRKNFADSRLRVKGRFVKKEDEENMMRLAVEAAAGGASLAPY